MSEYKDLLTTLLVTVISVALPILLVWLRQWLNEKKGELRQQVGEQQWYQMRQVVALFCEAAEQTGLKTELLKTGAEKKAWVLDQMDAWLKATGVPIDIKAVEAAVEATVYNWNQDGARPKVTYKVLPVEQPPVTEE